jgi:hypothetical protein
MEVTAMSAVEEKLSAAQKLAEMIVRHGKVDLVRRNTITFRFDDAGQPARAAVFHEIARSSAKIED